MKKSSLEQRCIKCGAPSMVLETRNNIKGGYKAPAGATLRRRECTSCGYRWPTYNELICTQNQVRADDLAAGMVILANGAWNQIDEVITEPEWVVVGLCIGGEVAFEPGDWVNTIGVQAGGSRTHVSSSRSRSESETTPDEPLVAAPILPPGLFTDNASIPTTLEL